MPINSCMAYTHKYNECKNAYKRKNTLQRHQETKHRNHVYACDGCSQHFKFLTYLKRHKKQNMIMVKMLLCRIFNNNQAGKCKV